MTGNSGTEGKFDGVALPEWSVEQHLAVMDQHGIAVGILSLPSLGDIVVGSKGRAMARAMNEELAVVVAEHPTRFGALATVPMDDPEAANEEMAYALDVLKLDGVTASTHCQGAYLGETIYDPWFAEMNRRAVTLFVHPSKPVGFDAEKSRLNVSILEYMFDTTRMVASMVLSGAKGRFSAVKIIATHGGGTIPYLAARICSGGQMPWAYKDGVRQSVSEITAALASFNYDLTLASSPAQIGALLESVTADRLVMGFDFPMMPVPTIAPAIQAIRDEPRFDERARQKIFATNATGLFPRFSPHC